jgi:hypothetical protein
MTEKINTIKTEQFNNFIWKKIPIEQDYITIVFCLSKYNSLNSEKIFEDILNENTKKLLNYIINIMPSYCVVNVENFSDFIFHKNNETNLDLKKIKNNINNIHLNQENQDIEYLEKRIKKINNKKTYIFTYNSNSEIESKNNDENINLKKIFNLSISDHFNETHKLCIGEIENIPKHILCMADYIFFEDKDILNKYLEMFHHNIRIYKSNTSIYLLDKCNYEYYNLFSFNNHL